MDNFGQWIRTFGIPPEDPGYIYLIQSGDRFKIGKTAHKLSRFAAAKTWLPDMAIVGIKPFWNVTWIEKCLHQGFAASWYAGEWFEPIDEAYRSILVDGFSMFSDSDRDRNSVDFIYWFNGDGMAELVIENNSQGISLKQFQKQVTGRHQSPRGRKAKE